MATKSETKMDVDTSGASQEEMEVVTKDTEAKEIITKETITVGSSVKETEGKEMESKKMEGKEMEGKETEGKETEGKETEGRERDDRETEVKEVEGKESEGKKSQAKESQAKETETKEMDAKDTEVKEMETKETEAQETAEAQETETMEIESMETEAMETEASIMETKETESKVTDTNEIATHITETSQAEDVVTEASVTEKEVMEAAESKEVQTMDFMSNTLEIKEYSDMETKEAESKMMDATDTASETADSISTANEDDKDNLSQGSENGEEKLKEEECYCGKERTLEGVELQCSGCLKWFHAGCVSINIGYCMSFMTAYSFTCRLCHPSNTEQFTKKTCNFSQLCIAALANLTHQQKKTNKPKRMFSKDKELVPYINRHWEYLSAMPRRNTSTWHNSIVKAMNSNPELFIWKEKPTNNEDENEEEFPLFGLADEDLSKVGPSYDKQLLFVKSDFNQKIHPVLTGTLTSGNLNASGKGRSNKRKGGLENSQNLISSKKTRSDLTASQKLPPHGYPLEHPYNKDGYRYILTEPDPHSPATTFDHDQFIGKPIPAHLYRAALGNDVLLALHDRAPQLKISDDRLSVTGEKGYSMVRGTHGVNRGSWYFEVIIDELPQETCTRIGWSLSLGNLQAPLGYDKFSYSWRSKKGTKFHCSRGKHYGDSYGAGDVLGFYLKMPNNITAEKLLPPTCKDKALIKFKSHLYFEEKDPVQEVEQRLQQTEGGQIIFYKNGVNQGIAWENIYEGTYYPSISLYKNAVVRANFGPDFQYPPTDLGEYEPLQSAARQCVVENTLADILYHVQHEDVYIEALNLVAACS